ncbi:hypothetical protein, partial [Aeromonas sp. QDB25]|uniref:hypothetical protein n=1 Tax=Aeromonas sp. QDB25 TaxID=2989832 RepID=UPI0022E250E6
MVFRFVSLARRSVPEPAVGLFSPMHHGCCSYYLNSRDTIKKCIEVQGKVPEFIQISILYELFWHIKRIVNNSGNVSFLSNEDKIRYVSLLEEIFSYIDDKVILEFNLSGSREFR